MLKIPFLAILLAALLAMSCKPQVPSKYIQPDEFEDILYDYHLADAMAANSASSENGGYDIMFYRQAVFKKYGITQAEFDSSLAYYVRHADRLHKIYDNLAKRFGNEALSLGASANDISRYGDMKSSKDTSNLWRGVPSCVLMSAAPYNIMTFDIEADSTYRKGDKMILSFNSDFISKDGINEGVAMLAVQFANDSVASSAVHISSNSNYSLSVSDDGNKGVKHIRGFFFLGNYNHSGSSSPAPLRLMFIEKIHLVRQRRTVETPIQPATSALAGRQDSMSGKTSKPGNTDTLPMRRIGIAGKKQ